MRHTLQEQIASLMGDGMLGNNGTMQNAGMADNDEIDTAPAPDVQDGRANTVRTMLNECAASSCANNVNGERCSLTQITVNQTGGCADYEPAADDYDKQDVADEQTIAGISTMMPERPDHPSAQNNMTAKYNDRAGGLT